MQVDEEMRNRHSAADGENRRSTNESIIPLEDQIFAILQVELKPDKKEKEGEMK